MTGTIQALYELTLAIGSEVTVRPLLTRVLEQSLEHSGLSVGLVLEVSAGEVRLGPVVGDLRLAALEGQAVPVPLDWVQGDLAQLRGAAGFPPGTSLFAGAGFGLRLPVQGLGALVLLGPESSVGALPLEQLFRPVLGNLSRAVLLCRANEAHTAQLERELELERARSRAALSALQQTARDREAVLERAQRLSRTGSWTLDFGTGVVRTSLEAERIAGIPSNVPVSLAAVKAALHPDDVRLVTGGWTALLRGQPYDLEHRLLVSGHTRWVRSRVELERGADGAPRRALGAVQDITERRRVEQQVRQLSLAVEQSPETTVITNLEGAIEYVNDAYLRVTGFSRDEVLGKNPRLIQSGKTPRATYDEMWATLGRGETWRGEFINRRKDGTEFLEQAIISPLRQPDGEVTHYVALKKDITETRHMAEELEAHRHHLEQLVQQRTDQLAAIFRALPDLYFRIDAQGVILEYQASTRAALYVPPEQFLGRRMQDVLPASVRERFDDALARLARGESKVELEYELPIGGAMVTFEARFVPVPHGQAVVVVRDMTESMRIRQALAVARDAAEEANRAKSAFLANMSHEIRTPMNAILGFTHLLRPEMSSRRQQDQLEKIAGASRHLLSIINDILDFSKIEANKLVLERAEFDVERAMSGVCELVSERAHARGLEVVLDLDGLPRRALGDSVRVRQVLLNFCSNAVKFTEQGHVRISGRVLRAEEETTWFRFEVTDTGIGLDAEQRSRLFLAFEQGDLSTTRRYGGTGLGLAIARRLAQLMGGEVGCESEPRQGSTFWLEVPLGTVPAAAAQFVSAPGLAGARVLVVDALPVSGEVLRRMLLRLGLRPEVVASGEAAVHAVGLAAPGDSYRLVMMDARMPGLGGLEAARQISSTPAGSRPRLLLMSSQAEPADWRDAGFDDFLSKPVTLHRVDEVVWGVLGAERTAGAAPVSRTSDPMRAVRARAEQQPLRVLLAEDNELNREVAVELLRSIGLSTECAVDGREAVAMAQATPYDLILMDVHMPELNGLEATRAIRALPGCAQTPILALTASAFGDERDACFAAGMTDHLAKPVDPEALWRALLRWWPARVYGGATPLPMRPDASQEDQRAWGPMRARLARIDGLDVRRGLLSVNGNLALLARLVSQFPTGHGGDAERLLVQWEEGDLERALRTAHTLKSVAGMLGMAAVYDLALELEQAAKARQAAAAARPRIELLGNALHQLSRAIQAQAGEGPSPASVVDWGALAEGLRRLEGMLAGDDTRAGEVHHQLQGGLAAALGAQASALGAAIDAFDYPGAATVLRGLLATEPRLRKG